MNAPGKTSKVDGTGYTYRYLLPKNLDSSKSYPLVIYLHPSSDNGSDGLLPLQAGNNTANGALALVSSANPDNQTKYPCIFVVPQCPVGKSWTSDETATQILAIYNTLYSLYHINITSVCLTGVAEGGTACFDLPYRVSQVPNGFLIFTRTVPVSASFDVASPLPVSTQAYFQPWVFHAADDSVASIASADTYVAGLRNKYNRPVVYSRYQTGGHSIGEVAYQHPQLLNWISTETVGNTQSALSHFTVTGESRLNGGTAVSLNGTAASDEGFTGISWTDDANSGSGSVSGSLTPTWSIPNIPLSPGTNNIQVIATAPNNTAAVFGTPTNYGGNLTVNLPVAVSPQTNVALNRPVTVSSVQSAGTPGSSAVDGDSTTRWSSAFSDPQWIAVDLGANYNLSRVDLTWEAACGKDYQIQASADNTHWTTLTAVAGNAKSGLISYYYGFNATTEGNAAPVARYLRVYGTARATQYGYSIFELAVFAQNTIFQPVFTPLVDVALNKKVTVSSTENSTNVGANAVDGNPDTRWSSAYSDPQWIMVDLGDLYLISDIQLTWEKASGKDFQLQASTDGVNWTTLQDNKGITQGGFQDFPYIGSPTCRYVRMYGTARNTQWGYSLYNFSVYSDGVPRSNLKNLAAGATATASSQESSAYPASNAIDGNSTTRWSSAYSDPQWIIVDLGTAHPVTEVDLNWEAACGKNYSIETSADGYSWKSQISEGGNTTAGWHKYPFYTAESARYVRINCQTRATKYGYSLYEISVLGH